MNVLELLKQVTTMVFDVDGVLTDGTLFVLPDGLMARRMNIKDGYALQLAVKRGYNVAVISGGNSIEVKERLNKLGIEFVYMAVTNKLACLETFIFQEGLALSEVLFMGDDIPDLEVMQKVGVACCPADAVSEIKEISALISQVNGGYGCAREIIEKVLKVRGHWHEDTSIRSQ